MHDPICFYKENERGNAILSKLGEVHHGYHVSYITKQNPLQSIPTTFLPACMQYF